jgi:hypothetical protein
MRSFITCILLQNIIGVIKSRNVRWAGHVIRMGEMRYAYTNLVRKSEWNGPLEELGVDGRIILERILEK